MSAIEQQGLGEVRTRGDEMCAFHAVMVVNRDDGQRRGTRRMWLVLDDEGDGRSAWWEQRSHILLLWVLLETRRMRFATSSPSRLLHFTR